MNEAMETAAMNAAKELAQGVCECATEQFPKQPVTREQQTILTFHYRDVIRKHIEPVLGHGQSDGDSK